MDTEKEKPKEAKKNKKYLVLKQFTGEKVHLPSQTVTLDSEAHSTKKLLTDKFIK